MRCFFNLVREDEIIPDPVGIEVEDIVQARVQALHAIAEMREEIGDAIGNWEDWQLQVVDSVGRTLFTVDLS
ncbi:hypothetical protein AB4072_07985 [Microvirga sp. 2MCAF38]|uniref:DUF6894 family protein n=1 Tax=Microvirga sp. 2MCAF38 TaxID=3232989 RepID=UPI003F975526